jgi:mitogen-activated protein kinase kinase
MNFQPERVKGEQYTIRSDVWSTGITLLEIVLNRYPYPVDEGPVDMLLNIVRGPVCFSFFFSVLLMGI